MAAQNIDRTLVAALRKRLQAESGQDVALVETHLSWVLLTPALAYKLKKPVRLPFVDFSALAARRHFCEEELRLNRALARGLYLGVEPVCGTRARPRIGGEGEAIDYLVCMRRFSEGALLGELLQSGRLGLAEFDAFAVRLAAFHGAASVAPELSTFGAPEEIERIALETLGRLGEAHCDGVRLAALQHWLRERAQDLHMTWLQRKRGASVRECHGDLHLANVVRLEGELLPFDCVEFDPALRWIDVMSDLAFLSMDLKAHGRADLAFRFLDIYLQHSGDYEGLPVLRFYEVYRALVRALVGCLRRQEAGADVAAGEPDYLACAEQIARGADGGPRLLITHGFSGAGKSTVAGQLLEAAGAIRIRSDVERKRLFGLGALQRSTGQELDIYTPEATRRTFARLADAARASLLAGYPVIVDAAFLRHAERATFRALAASLRVPFAILDLRADARLLRHRVAARDTGRSDASEADLAVLERQFAFHEALDARELAACIVVDAREPTDAAALHACWTRALHQA
ncbi:AAA family ATPase [Variovorax sp. LARHSF232]